MKTIQTVLIVATVISGIGFGASRLGYITNPTINIIIFAALFVSVAGDAALALIALWKKKKFGAEQVSAFEIIKKALDLACIAMSADGQHNFRASVFVACTDDKDKICIRYYSTNMEEAKDRNLSFAKWQGCAGQAWGYSAPVVADLTLPDIDGGSKWGLTEKQLELTKDLGAIIAVPVRLIGNSENIIAVLSFDTEEAIADLLIRDHHKEIASEVASEIGLLLAGFDQANPLT